MEVAGDAILPVSFVPDPSGETDFLVAELPIESAACGSAKPGPTAPFFLEPAEHVELLRFIAEKPSSTEQVLVLTGPVKSGKSMVLRKVLPGLVVAQLTAGQPQPVFLRCAFNLKAGPGHAARRLLLEARRVGATMGIALNVPASPHDCLVNLAEIMGAFARAVSSMGMRLWILLDETPVRLRSVNVNDLCFPLSFHSLLTRVIHSFLSSMSNLQAPLLAATTVAEAEMFASTLKDLVGTCSPVSRVVETGSAIVTLLNQLRLVRSNGFDIWAASSFLQLGLTPRAAAVRSMVTRLLRSYAAASAWPEPLCSPERIARVQALLTPGGPGAALVSPRPALVALMASLMGDGRRGDPDTVVDNAWSALTSKLRDESMMDALFALQQLDPDVRQRLWQLASGTGGVSVLPAGDARADKIATFVRLLCDERLAPVLDAAAPAPPLLPPYGALLQSCVNADGALLLRAGKQAVASLS